ncbi:hypothetical protein GE061_004019 [Apolygus lucorum]|uniref:Catalase core domain-containing protein n=1 Tax=Apolygus lucorum TaxID=248454 RepID=A0A8S9X0P3_APOLU|nr:hypothetical protein GE061_004019 [Apolygus lucorum]
MDSSWLMIEGYGQNNPASLELLVFAQNNTVIGNFTRADGVPIYDTLNSMAAGRFGPIVLQDGNFIEEMQHFDRERLPERVVHAKGAGAFGYFVCTNDLSKYTQARVLTDVGKRTPVAVRFSRIGGNQGEADTVRDGRGFAIKFYTDQGNWDLVGLNLPVFWIRDTMRFPSLIHVNKRNPVTNLYDPVMFWDFISLLPETLTMILNVFSDRGIPMSYRTMDGHSTNSFSLTRPDGQITFVKFHLQSNQGVKNMPPDQATVTAGVDADFHVRDLFDNIAKGNFPSWNVSVELLAPENAKKMPWNPFDPTKVWPPALTTMLPMGVLLLNQNPTNFFAQVEQLAFDPSRLVPGIEPTVDRVLQGRLFSYTDTAMYRLGVNNQLLPVNRPMVAVANRERDGTGRTDGNQGGSPNYFPNSFNGPRGNSQFRTAPFPVQGLVQSYNSTQEDNYSVPALLWKELGETEKNSISTNIVQTLSQTPQFIQERALNNFYQVSPDWGNRVASLLNLSGFTPQAVSESS